MCHLKNFVFFSHYIQSMQDRISPLQTPSLPLWFAYRNKTKQFTVGASQNSSFPFSSQDLLGCFFLHVYTYTHTYTDIHTLASSEIVVTFFGFLLWPVPEVLLPAHPADLPAPGHWLAEAPKPWCTSPGSLCKDLWLPWQSFNPIHASFLNWLHKPQTGLWTIASFPQKCHYFNKTETHSSTTSSLHW